MNRLSRPLLGVVLAGVLVGAAACGDDDDDDFVAGNGSGDEVAASAPGRDTADSRSPAEATKNQPASAQSAAGGTTGGSDGGAPLPSQIDRKIIFNATIALEVPNLQSAFSDVSVLAQAAGGYIEKSSFTGNDDESSRNRSASLTLRVPTDEYQPTLTKLRAMDGVKVKSESSKSNEVTEQYTDLKSRQKVLEATEKQYLDLLAKAVTIPDILTMTDRLNAVRSQIEQVQGRISVFDRLTEFTTIDVFMTPIIAAKPEVKKPDDGPKSLRASFVDAWDGSLLVARHLASFGAGLSAVLIWLAVPLAGLAWFIRRQKRLNARRAPVAPPPPQVPPPPAPSPSA